MIDGHEAYPFNLENTMSSTLNLVSRSWLAILQLFFLVKLEFYKYPNGVSILFLNQLVFLTYILGYVLITLLYSMTCRIEYFILLSSM